MKPSSESRNEFEKIVLDYLGTLGLSLSTGLTWYYAFVHNVTAESLGDARKEGIDANYKEVDSVKDEIEKFNGSMRDLKNGDSIMRDFRGDSLEEALENLEPNLDFVVSYLGWIPKCFHEVVDQLLCYVHVDPQHPPLDSLEFFHTHLVEGGILLCDDVGFMTFPGSATAFDAFLSDKPAAVIALRDGGFLTRGKATAEPDPYFELPERSSSTH